MKWLFPLRSLSGTNADFFPVCNGLFAAESLKLDGFPIMQQLQQNSLLHYYVFMLHQDISHEMSHVTCTADV